MVFNARNFLVGAVCVLLSAVSAEGQQSNQVTVGSTYYDFQSFRSLPTRLVYNPENNNLQLVWMAAEDGSDLQQIFTYYASFDVTDVGPSQNAPWSAVETSRGLWGGIAEFSDGTIGVASHTPVKFSKNNFQDIGGFNTYATNSPGSFFPRTAAGTGSQTHLVYATNPQEAELVYKRSEDAGANWSNATILTGENSVVGELPLPMSADAYAFDANGATVALAYVDADRQVHLVMSNNNGDTWSASTIVAADFGALTEIEDLGGGQVRFESSPQWLAGGDIDVQVDSDGTAHIVTQALFSTLRGIGAQNGGIERIGNDTLYSDVDSLRARGLMYVNSDDQTFELFASPGGDNGWDGIGTFLPAERASSSMCAYPQLSLGLNGDVFVVYSAPKTGDRKTVTLPGGDVDAAMGHIYSTLRTADGQWQRQVDNSPNGKDCTYPAIARFADERVFIAYQQDERPGVASGPGGTTLTGKTDVMVRGVERDAYRLDIGVEDFTQSQIHVYPQPAIEELTIQVPVIAASNPSATVEVFAISGVREMQLTTTVIEGKLTVDVSKLAAGTYVAQIKIGGATHECAFVVR